MKQKTKLERALNIIVFSIQFVMTSLFIGLIYYANFLPMNYIIIAGVILVVFLAGLGYLIFYKKPKAKRTIFAEVISIILSIVMAIGSSYTYKVSHVVNLMTDGNFQSRAISVIVLDESTIKNSSTIKGHTFGIVTSLEPEVMEYAVNDINKECGTIETTEYPDLSGMMKSLYSKEVDGIILDEAFRTLFEDEYENLDTETRVVYQTVKDESEVTSNAVDVTTKPFVVYISGNDLRGKLSAVSRSDVNMVAVINPTTKQVLLVSIPRDSYVPLHRNGQYDKLTHSGMYGLQETISTVEDFLDEKVNYYGRLNFTSFIDIVDAIGGVTINNPVAFTSAKVTGSIKFEKGTITINAKEALAYVRERKAFADGDFARNRNQQRMFSAILKKVCSPAIITSFSSVLDVASQCCETNLSANEINALVQMQLLQSISWDVQSYQIVGAAAMDPCYSAGNQVLSTVRPYENSVQEARNYINQIMNNEKIQTETGDLDSEGAKK